MKRFRLRPEPPFPLAALEINAGILRLCAFAEGDAEMRFRCLASRPLPDGAVVPGPTEPNVREPEALRQAVHELFEESGGTRKALSLLLPDACCRASILEFESLPASRRDREALLRFRMKKTLPFPVEQARLGSALLRPRQGQVRLLCVVGHEAVLSGYEDALAPLGIAIGLIDVSTFNLLTLVSHVRRAGRTTDDGSYMVVNVDLPCFSVAIVRDDDLVFYRSKLASYTGEGAGMTAENLVKEVRLCHLYFTERLEGGEIGTLYLREARRSDPRLPAELSAEGTRDVRRVDPFEVVKADPDLEADFELVGEAAPLVGMVLSRRLP